MWRRPFLGHPIRDRCRTYAAIDGGSPPRATPLPSFGNLEPVRKEQWVQKKEGHFHGRSITILSSSTSCLADSESLNASCGFNERLIRLNCHFVSEIAGRAFCRWIGTAHLAWRLFSTRKQLSKRSIVTLDSARELREVRRPLRQVFRRNRSRYDAYDRVPATRLFFHGN